MRVAFVLLALACTQQPSAPPVETATTAPVQAQQGPRVILPSGVAIGVEVVADPELRAQGLMFRDHLRPLSGMIFLFPTDGNYTFWMKNTMIPLDMIWIDSSKKIVQIIPNVPPCKIDDCPSYGSEQTVSRYVLELAAGEAARLGLKKGDQLRLEGMDNVAVR